MSNYLLSGLKHGNSRVFKSVLKDERWLKSLIGDNEVFCNLKPKEVETIDFQQTPDYKLDENSFFYINYLECSCSEGAQEAIKKIIGAFESTASCGDIQSKDLNKVEFLLYGNATDGINVQVITPKFFIKSKKYLKFFDTKETEYKHEDNILTLNDSFDLHIDISQNKILFKKFDHLIKIHKDFIGLYREATKQEQTNLIRKINETNLFIIDHSIELKSSNLKKIKYWLDNDVLSSIFDKQDKLERYLNKYKKQLHCKEIDGKINVQNNKDFTALSKIIDERFYRTEITERDLESNSSKIIIEE